MKKEKTRRGETMCSNLIKLFDHNTYESRTDNILFSHPYPRCPVINYTVSGQTIYDIGDTERAQSMYLSIVWRRQVLFLNDLSSFTYSRSYPIVTFIIPFYSWTFDDYQSKTVEQAVTRYYHSIGILANDNFIFIFANSIEICLLERSYIWVGSVLLLL